MLRILSRIVWLPLLCAAVAASTAYGITATRTETYRSTLTLLLTPQSRGASDNVFNSSDYVATRARSYASLVSLDEFARRVAAPRSGKYPYFGAQYQAETALVRLESVDVSSAGAQASATAAARLLMQQVVELEALNGSSNPLPVVVQVASGAEAGQPANLPGLQIAVLATLVGLALGVAIHIGLSRQSRPPERTAANALNPE